MALPTYKEVQEVAAALTAIGVNPCALRNLPDDSVACAVQEIVEETAEQLTLQEPQRAVENAHLVVATMTELVDNFPASIEEDNTRTMVKVRGDGTKTSSTKRLRGNSAKEVIRAFKTSVPVLKIMSMDPVVREYLMYTLLTIAARMRQ